MSEIPADIKQRLGSFRWRLVCIKLAETAAYALVGFLLSYLLVFAIERLIDTHPWGRLLLLVTGTIGFTLGLPMALRRWVWGTRRFEQIAKFLRKRFPVEGDEILSVVEIATQQQYNASPVLIEAATRQTCRRIENVDLNQAAPALGAQWKCVMALAFVAVAVGIWFTVPSAAQNAWARFLNPWSGTPRFTFTDIASDVDRQIIAYAEPFEFTLPLDQDSAWQPATATAVLGESKFTAKLDADQMAYHFKIPGQANDVNAMFRAGDATHQVKFIPTTRPELQKIVANIQPPEYLEYAEPIQQTTTSRNFSVIDGGSVQFDVYAGRELESATLDGREIEPTGEFVSVQPIRITEDRLLEIEWNDKDGLQATSPVKIMVQNVADRAPSVVFHQFDETVLLLKKSLEFEYSANDDFGIRKIGLQWTGEASLDGTEPVVGEKLLFAQASNVRDANEKASFSPWLEGLQPQTLTLRLFVEDYLPGRKRIYSRAQTIQVMSDDEHLKWLNEQMEDWQTNADSIFERELALAQENRDLSLMSEDQQRDPEFRRRVEAQAAAERDNARRLEQAVDEGRDLIQEALRNESIRSEQVANWAEAISRLQDIAEQRMPAISEQLEQVAEQSEQDSRNESENSSENNSDNPNQSGEQNQTDEQNQEQPNQNQQDNQNPPGTPPVGENRDPANPNSENSSSDEDENESEEGDDNPQVQDVESSMLDEPEENEEEGGDGQQTPPGGNLTIPETLLRNPNQPSSEEQEAPQQEQPQPEPSMDGVVEDQEKLLEEFEKAREAMGDVMSNLENSTFVKRLKAASREQVSISENLSRQLSVLYGADNDQLVESSKIESIVAEQKQQEEAILEIKKDLAAFQSREPEDNRQAILDEMASSKMEIKLKELPLRLERNRIGDVIHRSDFWADTFDRWAEELVPPATENGGQNNNNNQQQRNLPPAILLDILRQIEDESMLRDETRDFNLARPGLDTELQQRRNDGLSVYQMAIQERTLDSIDDINLIPGGAQAFEAEMNKLKNAANAMDEASGMLLDGTTNDPAIASESAAIEALLQTNRQNPNPTPNPTPTPDPQQDGSEGMQQSPLSELFADSDPNPSQVPPRDVGAGLGVNRDLIPEEFRQGVDDFSNKFSRLKGARDGANE